MKKSCLIYIESKQYRLRLTQIRAEFMPISMTMSYLETKLPIVKNHLLMRKDKALMEVCLLKYHFPAPLKVHI